jgi:asparagine synthase (glutamine-hydrolysing)
MEKFITTENCVSNLKEYNFQTESDCEVILALIRKKDLIYSDEMYFWFYIYDVEKNEYPLITSQYYSIIHWLGSTWNFYVASELKALKVIAQKFNCFLQGII